MRSIASTRRAVAQGIVALGILAGVELVAWPADIASIALAARPEALARIGPAPAFALTTQDGKSLSLQDLHGKVVLVTFIFTTCPDTCPVLTYKMAGLQKRLGRDFGSRVHFVSMTVDPERDTPDVLRRYAQGYGANFAGWSFLTGDPDHIDAVVRAYGVFAKKQEGGNVDHTFLTSVVDQSGTLRVQYMGTRFDPGELLKDIRALLHEANGR